MNMVGKMKNNGENLAGKYFFKATLNIFTRPIIMKWTNLLQKERLEKGKDL